MATTMVKIKALLAKIVTQISTLTTDVAGKADASDLADYLPLTGGTLTGGLTVGGSIKVEGHDTAIGEIKNQSASISVTSGTTWTNRNSGIVLTVSPGTWLVTAYASCPGSTTGDRALGITYGTAAGNLVQSRTTMRANAGSSIAAMQTTMAVVTNTSNRNYTVEYWQNSGSSKTVDFRLYAVRIV